MAVRASDSGPAGESHCGVGGHRRGHCGRHGFHPQGTAQAGCSGQLALAESEGGRRGEVQGRHRLGAVVAHGRGPGAGGWQTHPGGFHCKMVFHLPGQQGRGHRDSGGPRKAESHGCRNPAGRLHAGRSCDRGGAETVSTRRSSVGAGLPAQSRIAPPYPSRAIDRGSGHGCVGLGQSMNHCRGRLFSPGETVGRVRLEPAPL